ncbi:hypothetical protein AAC387_Pa03g4417 [Persea americana]
MRLFFRWIFGMGSFGIKDPRNERDIPVLPKTQKTFISIDRSGDISLPQSSLFYKKGATMGSNNAAAGLDKEQIFGMAEKEMEYRVDLFNRLTQTCFDKCIEKRYKESELNMGENSCIDRCVSKYWQVTNLIGQLLGSNRPPM